ncbi:hypothetical protein C8J57DRAFT_1009046, partial [Mycena rebaudengoi]
KIKVTTKHQVVSLSLRKIIYHGSNPFVARIFSKAGDMWLHNGIATGRNTVYEGNI